jgi:hypothetical protein
VAVVGGGVWYYPPYYPYYYPYYPPAYLTEEAPPIQYVEKDSEEQQSKAYRYYYCASVQAYYPYVTDCPDGWQEVAPVPSN